LQGCEYGQETLYLAKSSPGSFEYLLIHIREALLAIEQAVGERHCRCAQKV
jgi:hypothetical protein